MEKKEKIILTNKQIASDKMSKEKGAVRDVTRFLIGFAIASVVLFVLGLLGFGTLYADIVFGAMTVMLGLGLWIGTSTQKEVRDEIMDGNFFMLTDTVRRVNVNEKGVVDSLMFEHYGNVLKRNKLTYMDNEVNDEFYFFYMSDKEEPFAIYPCRHYQLDINLNMKQAQW